MAPEHIPDGTFTVDQGGVRGLFRRAEAEEFTGRFILKSGADSCSFFFKEGAVVHAKTSREEHRLGVILERECRFDHRAVILGLRLSKLAGKPLGKVLVEEKVLDPRELYTSLVAQVELIARWAVSWSVGTCHIHRGVLPGKDIVPLKVTVEQVLRAVEKAPHGTGVPPVREVEAAAPPAHHTRATGAHRAPASAAAASPSVAEPMKPAPAPEREKPSAPTAHRRTAWDEAAFREFLGHQETLGDDHCAVLGVRHEATEEEVRLAYGKLVRTWHPDKVGHRLGDLELARLQAVFAGVNAAYGVLSHKEKRAAWERERREVLGQHKHGLDGPVEEALRVFRAGIQLHKGGDFSSAADYFRKASQLDSRQSRYFYYLGSTLLRLRKLKPAEEALLNAIRIDEGNPDAYAALGQVYKAGKLFTRAVEMFDRALRWDSRHQVALREKQSLSEE